jgi:hypothetical protein
LRRHAHALGRFATWPLYIARDGLRDHLQKRARRAGGRGGSAPAAAEHLVEGDDESHGHGRVEPRVGDEAEHVVADRLLAAHLGHGVPVGVAHRAGTPPVRLFHHVRRFLCLLVGGGDDVRQRLGRGGGTAAEADVAADGEERPAVYVADYVAVVDEPALREAEEALSAHGEERLAGDVHEDHICPPASSTVAVDAEGEVAVGVEDGEAIAVEQQRLAPPSAPPPISRLRRRALRPSRWDAPLLPSISASLSARLLWVVLHAAA